MSDCKEKNCSRVSSELPPIVDLRQSVQNPDKNMTTESFTSEDFHFLLQSVQVENTGNLTCGKTEFRCLHCKFLTVWRPSLVKHMKVAHSDTFDIHSILEIHTKDFGNISRDSFNNFQVMKMSEYVKVRVTLKSKPLLDHKPLKMEMQDKPGHFPCPTCHKVFSRLRYIRRHCCIHQPSKAHLCEVCGKSFKTLAVLSSHKQRAHSNLKNNPEETYCCPECGFTSKSRAAIHRHRQVHPCGALICEVCGTACADKSTLRRHTQVHDPSRPFACTHSGCTWRFKTLMMCRAHERSSHDLSAQTESKFTCSSCNYGFKRKHHLQRHIVKFHPELLSDETISELFKKSKLLIDNIEPKQLHVLPCGDSSTIYNRENDIPNVISEAESHFPNIPSQPMPSDIQVCSEYSPNNELCALDADPEHIPKSYFITQNYSSNELHAQNPQFLYDSNQIELNPVPDLNSLGVDSFPDIQTSLHSIMPFSKHESSGAQPPLPSHTHNTLLTRPITHSVNQITSNTQSFNTRLHPELQRSHSFTARLKQQSESCVHSEHVPILNSNTTSDTVNVNTREAIIVVMSDLGEDQRVMGHEEADNLESFVFTHEQELGDNFVTQDCTETVYIVHFESSTEL